MSRTTQHPPSAALVDLRGDDHHVLLAVFVVAENLPVADHLVDRERNVLLDLETDHLVEPVRTSGGRDGREAREHHLPGNRDGDWTRLDALLADDLEERRREERARVAGVERSGEGGDAVVDERQAAFPAFVFGKLHRGSADV